MLLVFHKNFSLKQIGPILIQLGSWKWYTVIALDQLWTVGPNNSEKFCQNERTFAVAKESLVYAKHLLFIASQSFDL